MRTEKLEQAEQIARRHIEVDSDVRRVLLLELPEHEEDNPDEPIKLLEVVEGTPEVGYEPLGFARNPGVGVKYPMVILEISPREYKGIRGQEVEVGEAVWRITRELAVSRAEI